MITILLKYFVSNIEDIVPKVQQFDAILIACIGPEAGVIEYFKVVEGQTVAIKKADFDSVEKSVRKGTGGSTRQIVIAELGPDANKFRIRTVAFRGSGLRMTYELIHTGNEIKHSLLQSMIMR